MDQRLKIYKAVSFMVEAHGDQKRKYTGEPYAVHPIEVAVMIAMAGFVTDVQIAALLHDVIEDTNKTYADIEREFGKYVADLVLEVTDKSKLSDGNRAIRKAIDLEHLAKTSFAGASIKLADLTSNTKSIVEHDNGFAVIYLKEKGAVLKVLKHGHPDLYAMASAHIEKGLG